MEGSAVGAGGADWITLAMCCRYQVLSSSLDVVVVGVGLAVVVSGHPSPSVPAIWVRTLFSEKVKGAPLLHDVSLLNLLCYIRVYFCTDPQMDEKDICVI